VVAVKPPSAPAEGFTQQFYIRVSGNTHLVFLSDSNAVNAVQRFFARKLRAG